MYYNRLRALLTVGGLLGTLFPMVALAGAPQLDTGVALSQDKPYESAQKIDDIFVSKTIYGKVDENASVDIYSFTPSKSGKVPIQIMTNDASSGFSPLIIFMDPTDSTKAEQLQIQLPGPNYHAAILKQADANTTYTEPVLLQKYTVTVSDTLQVQKGTQYFFLIGDAYSRTGSYAIKLGSGHSWTAKDFFLHFATWFRLEVNAYSNTSPFTFTSHTASLLVLLLGLLILTGIFIVQEVFAALANRIKAAGYLLIRLQPFSKILIWIGLWFIALGGYLFFAKNGWIGLPFLLIVLFIVLLISLLYQTIRLSPRLAELEVTKKEATVPFSLRKRWFFSTLVTLFSLGAFITFLTMYLVK